MRKMYKTTMLIVVVLFMTSFTEAVAQSNQFDADHSNAVFKVETTDRVSTDNNGQTRTNRPEGQYGNKRFVTMQGSVAPKGAAKPIAKDKTGAIVTKRKENE